MDTVAVCRNSIVTTLMSTNYDGPRAETLSNLQVPMSIPRGRDWSAENRKTCIAVANRPWTRYSHLSRRLHRTSHAFNSRPRARHMSIDEGCCFVWCCRG